MQFQHEVAEDIRTQSAWNADYAAFQAPDGRYWSYTDDPKREGVSWRDGAGNPISVAVWLVNA